MLEALDLSRKVGKADYREERDRLQEKLAELQRAARTGNIPIVIVFEGWGASGKGTLINNLIQPLDPRGFRVHTTQPPTADETMHPFLWRFWQRLPARGQIAIFDRSWYQRVLRERFEGKLAGKGACRDAIADICSFERLLTDEGTLILKFFLHIDRKEQKKRFRRLRDDKTTEWRVSSYDRKQHRRYDDYRAVAEDMLAATDTGNAPWHVVEAHDERFATLKLFSVVTEALEKALTPQPALQPATASATVGSAWTTSMLDGIDLNVTLPREDYKKRLDQAQKRLRELEHELYRKRIPAVIVYEGWDAAGKGGNIRRLTQELDPRGYVVEPIAAPSPTELAHHYLWRFWTRMPKAGHISIFDRSWYGRVLVERVEGLCPETAWGRAYREINEMEQHLTHFGTVLVKFWLHIDADEQLRRFNGRASTPEKQWKITEDDWRNREKWDAYTLAVEEMLQRTSTPCAPWTIVESNCKRYARVKALETVIAAIEAAL